MTPAQLLARKQHIGASEAAAACGLSPWTTPYQLWADKTSDAVDVIDNPRMEWGRRLESVVLRKYAEDLPRPDYLIAPCDVVTSAEHPFMSCTPDALLPDRVVEVKTAGLSSAREWGEPGSDAVPMHYLLQVTHQMVVTGRRLADIPVLIAGNDYRLYTVNYDEELAALLIERERAFWRHVEDRTPPDVASIADAVARWPKDTGTKVEATLDVYHAILKMQEIKEDLDRLEADYDALQLAVKTCMAEHSTLVDSANEVLATWKAQSRSQFDYSGFKAKHPDLYAQFSQKQSTRVFRLARMKL